ASRRSEQPGAARQRAPPAQVARRLPLRPASKSAASPFRQQPPCCAHVRNSASPCPAQPGASGAKSPLAAPQSLSCRYYPSHSCLFLTAWLFSQIDGPAKRSGLAGRHVAALRPVRRVRSAAAIAAQTIRPCEKGRTRRPMFESSVYHICPPQCQIQLARPEEI